MRTCPHCGAQAQDDAAFCQYCGSRLDQYQYQQYDTTQYQQTNPYQQPQTQEPVKNGKATGSLVCGIISLFVAGLVLGIIAVTLAWQSKKEVGYELPNAKAGRICGIIALVFAGISLILSIAFASYGIRSGLFSGLFRNLF